MQTEQLVIPFHLIPAGRWCFALKKLLTVLLFTIFVLLTGCNSMAQDEVKQTSCMSAVQTASTAATASFTTTAAVTSASTTVKTTSSGSVETYQEPSADIDTPFYVGTWYATMGTEQDTVSLALTLNADGTVACRYDYIDSGAIELLEGIWFEADGILSFDLQSKTSDLKADFAWDFWETALVLAHKDGHQLGFAWGDDAILLLPFDARPFAGHWETTATSEDGEHETYYYLDLYDNGESLYTIVDDEEFLLAEYVGRWGIEDHCLTLNMQISNGSYCNDPNYNYLMGTYEFDMQDESNVILYYKNGDVFSEYMDAYGVDFLWRVE